MALPKNAPERYPPGAKVRHSGIYRVVHLQHRPPHEVLAIEGEELPQCRTCGKHVTFELLQGIALVTHDMDFAGPSWTLLKPSSNAA